MPVISIHRGSSGLLSTGGASNMKSMEACHVGFGTMVAIQAFQILFKQERICQNVCTLLSVTVTPKQGSCS
jgi:hypothetical protein